MSLLFDASTEKVNHGSASGLDNMDQGTTGVWFNLDTVTASSNGRLWQKGLAASGVQHLRTNNLSGDFMLVYQRATTNLQIQSLASVVSISKWTFVAAVWDFNGADGDQKLYVGDRDTPLAEVRGYTLQTTGSGAHTSNGFESMFIGNKSNDNANFIGRIASVKIWKDRMLNLNELRGQQFFEVPPGPNCSLYCEYQGVGTQLDRSGNGSNGTVTGATAASQPEFRLRRRFVYKSTGAPPTGRVMGGLAGPGGLAGVGGIAGQGGGLAA